MLQTICDLMQKEESLSRRLVAVRHFLMERVQHSQLSYARALYIYTQLTDFLYVLGVLSLEDMLSANGVATIFFKSPT